MVSSDGNVLTALDPRFSAADSRRVLPGMNVRPMSALPPKADITERESSGLGAAPLRQVMSGHLSQHSRRARRVHLPVAIVSIGREGQPQVRNDYA